MHATGERGKGGKTPTAASYRATIAESIAIEAIAIEAITIVRNHFFSQDLVITTCIPASTFLR